MEQLMTHPVAPTAGVRRRRPGSGALMLAAVMALAASGVAMGGSAGAQTKTYNLMITGVPSTVHAISLAVTHHEGKCFPVTPGKVTNIGYQVEAGDTMGAWWYSATPCDSNTLEHRSYTSVTASSNTNFWFDLTKTQKD